jgi:hypothetical protein
MVLEMDTASKGKVCITYYREMASSQYLRNIENWHKINIQLKKRKKIKVS